MRHCARRMINLLGIIIKTFNKTARINTNPLILRLLFTVYGVVFV